MSMKLLPVDGAWVDAMISLANGPWTRQAVERLFVDRGWIQADDAGTARVPWQTGGEVWPQLDLPVASGPLPDDSDETGWRLDLGAPPPDEEADEVDRHSFVALPFALLWPPLTNEEPDDSDETGWRLDLGAPPPDEEADEVDRHSFVALPFALLWPPLTNEEPDDEDDEDDLQEDYSAEWVRYPDAGPAEFEAEFHRVRALIEDRIGPPTRTVGDITIGWMRAIWDRGTMALTLSIEDDIATYSFYDHIALGIWPTAAAAGTEDT